VAGRIVAMRVMGKAAFLHLQDATGRIQVHLRRDLLDEGFRLLKELDLGDFLGARGPLFRTRTGEPTVEAKRITLLSKALRPPPDKWHGLRDTEQRYRQREVDLLSNEETRHRFILRSRTVEEIRRFLAGRDFIEVETPILVPVAAGAMAQPFVTRHNALDRALYLRIATELYLKRCIIGGLDRVFEMGRVFRNEGLDARHNPEFSTLESYQAYADYTDVMEMVESMVSACARRVLGGASAPWGDQTIDFTSPWPRLDLRQTIIDRAGVDIEELTDAPSLAERMRGLGIQVTQEASWGRLVDKLLSETVEPTLIQPTFLVDYPMEMSPLAREKPDDPGYVERFEAFAGGMEIANAFTELNDPQEQRRRFAEQEEFRGLHAQEDFDRLDEEFLTALEYGMPPTGGLGVGIDRLVMLFTNQSTIREVLLFPHLSWSQAEIFREIDKQVRAAGAGGARGVEQLMELVKTALPAEVLARTTDAELESRIDTFLKGGPRAEH
jgi:lysyl-tRNA synthetase class 2